MAVAASVISSEVVDDSSEGDKLSPLALDRWAQRREHKRSVDSLLELVESGVAMTSVALRVSAETVSTAAERAARVAMGFPVRQATLAKAIRGKPKGPGIPSPSSVEKTRILA